MQVIPKSFQPYISAQKKNSQNDTYAGKVKNNINKNETTSDEQTNNSNIITNS